MKCSVCKKNVASGAEAQKMIVEYEQPDESVKIFGYSMPDGPLPAATGRIVRAYHHKCFWIVRKREHRGGSGRVVAGVPTAYEIHDLVLPHDDAHGTAFLTEKLTELRILARTLGKGVGDPTVAEAYQAQQHGGPYLHTHHLPLDNYQLLAHLQFAHGLLDPIPAGFSPQQVHGQLHATAAQHAAHVARAADPAHHEPMVRDWRDQHVADV